MAVGGLFMCLAFCLITCLIIQKAKKSDLIHHFSMIMMMSANQILIILFILNHQAP